MRKRLIVDLHSLKMQHACFCAQQVEVEEEATEAAALEAEPPVERPASALQRERPVLYPHLGCVAL